MTPGCRHIPLIGVDGSYFNLPDTEETRQEFSVRTNPDAGGEQVQALGAVLHDLDDDDGEGIREVQTHTLEGVWTTARHLPRPFRGVHKKELHTYLAMGEQKSNRQRLSPTFIAQLVTPHQSMT